MTAVSTCGDGNEATVNFANTPLTNVSGFGGLPDDGRNRV